MHKINQEAVPFFECIKFHGLSNAIEMCRDYEVQTFIVQLKDIGLISKDDSLDYDFVYNQESTNFLSAPIKVFLTITDRCNLNCKHCFGNFGGSKTNEQDFLTIKKILKKLKEIGVFQVSITGGEPLLHLDIIKIFQEVMELGMQRAFIHFVKE